MLIYTLKGRPMLNQSTLEPGPAASEDGFRPSTRDPLPVYLLSLCDFHWTIRFSWCPIRKLASSPAGGWTTRRAIFRTDGLDVNCSNFVIFQTIDGICRHSIVPRDHFLTQIWFPLYESFLPLSLDQLALMFVILACGASVDSSRNPEADKYYQLARCIMTIKPSGPPSVIDVQIYVCRSSNRENLWLTYLISSFQPIISISARAGRKRGFSQA